ncbi:MAG: hypothetical protein ACP5G1_03505, partial [Nanopusillaceae archaeon]
MFEYLINKYYPEIINKSKYDKKLRKILISTIFFLNMLIYSIPLYLYSYYFIILPKNILIFYTNFLSSILNYLNINHLAYENLIYMKNFSFIISQECFGLKSFFNVFAMIFSTPIKNVY